MPAFGPDVPARFEVHASDADDGQANRDLAVFADALLYAGILNRGDWQGDLAQTVAQGLTRFGWSYGLGSEGSVFEHLSVSVITDVENTLQMDEGGDSIPEWRRVFGAPLPDRKIATMDHRTGDSPGSADFRVASRICGFSIHSDNCYSIPVAPWVRRIEKEFGEAVAGDFMGALDWGLMVVGGLTPSDACEWVEGWEDMDEPEEDADPDERLWQTSAGIREKLPAVALEYTCDLPRLRHAALSDSASADLLDSALRVVDALQAMKPDGYEAMDHNDKQLRVYSHRGYLARQVPPVFITWTGEINPDMPDYDPTPRVYDNKLELLQEEYCSDAVWAHFFDHRKAGDGPGTAHSAARALAAVIPVIGLLEQLLTTLKSGPPKGRNAAFVLGRRNTTTGETKFLPNRRGGKSLAAVFLEEHCRVCSELEGMR